MGRFKLLLLMLSMVSLSAFAKSKEPELSENIKNGISALYEGNYYEAREHFVKELQSNPKSGETYYWLGLLFQNYGDNRSALYDFGKALELLSPKNKSYLYSSRLGRAEVFISVGDTASAMADLDAAEKLSDKPVGVYNQRADILFYQGKRDASDAGFRKVLSWEPDNWTALMGMGRSYLRRLQYDKALEYFDKAIAAEPTTSDAYAFKAETYAEMKDIERATDNIVLAYTYSPYNRKAMYEMERLDDEGVALLVPKLKLEMLKNTETSCWNYHLGRLFETHYDYKNAILSYSEGLKRQFESFLALPLANCYNKLGHFKNGMKYSDLALRLDSTSTDALQSIMVTMIYQGDYQKLYEKADEFQKKYPDYALGYEKKALALQRMKRYAEAVDELSMALVVNTSSTYLRLFRGILNRELGKNTLFENDMKKCVELNSDTTDIYSVLAHAYLGEREKAVSSLSYAIEKAKKNGNTIEPGIVNFHWSALYAVLGEVDMSIDYLEKSLAEGIRDLEDMENALYFKGIQENARFKQLMKKYHAILEAEVKELDKMNSQTPVFPLELKSSELDRLY